MFSAGILFAAATVYILDSIRSTEHDLSLGIQSIASDLYETSSAAKDLLITEDLGKAFHVFTVQYRELEEKIDSFLLSSVHGAGGAKNSALQTAVNNMKSEVGSVTTTLEELLASYPNGLPGLIKADYQFEDQRIVEAVDRISHIVELSKNILATNLKIGRASCRERVCHRV